MLQITDYQCDISLFLTIVQTQHFSRIVKWRIIDYFNQWMNINADILKGILNAMSEAVVLLDPDGYVKYFNKEALKILGDGTRYDVEIASIFQPEDPKTGTKILSNSGEGIIRNKTGKLYIEFEQSSFEVESDVYQLLKLKDITMRKSIELQLEESEQMLMQIIDTVPHAIFLKDHNRKFVVANKKVADYHNKDVEDILGKSDEDLFTPEEYEPFIEAENRILSNKESVIIPEETFEDHEGNMRYIHSTKMPFYISSIQEWGILGVNLDITEVKKLQDEQTNLRLEHQNTLMQAVVDTQERERKMIAHNLHDGLGQVLTAAKMNINAYKALSTNQTARVDMINKAEELLDQAIYEVRNITGDLMPAILKDFGLTTALEKLCSDVSAVGRPKFFFSAHNVDLQVKESIAFNLYRITQEIINNIVKHSNAEEATLQLFGRDNELILQVEDDGMGFDLSEKKSKNEGLGLKSIENRVNLMNGTLDLDTGPGMGCSYTIIITTK